MRLRLIVFVAGLMALGGSLACGGGGSDGGGGQRLLLMDQNILHGFLDEDPAADSSDRFAERIHLIANALAEAQPDVVFLQEVFVGERDEYADVRAVLAEAMGPEYTQLFGDIQGGPINEGAIGQMTITRLPVIESENRHIGGARSVQHIALQTDDGVLDVYDAHLEGTGAVVEVGADQGAVEMQTVLDFIEETRSPGGAVVLAGDLNARPDDLSIQLLRDAAYVDALAEAGDATCDKQGDPGCTNSAIPLGDNPDHLVDQRIDYIFVLSGDELSASVNEASLWDNEPYDIAGGHTLWASDHIGVRATVELK